MSIFDKKALAAAQEATREIGFYTGSRPLANWRRDQGVVPLSLGQLRRNISFALRGLREKVGIGTPDNLAAQGPWGDPARRKEDTEAHLRFAGWVRTVAEGGELSFPALIGIIRAGMGDPSRGANSPWNMDLWSVFHRFPDPWGAESFVRRLSRRLGRTSAAELVDALTARVCPRRPGKAYVWTLAVRAGHYPASYREARLGLVTDAVTSRWPKEWRCGAYSLKNPFGIFGVSAQHCQTAGARRVYKSVV